MHVNDTSRPCGTVKLSSGARNSGSDETGIDPNRTEYAQKKR